MGRALGSNAGLLAVTYLIYDLGKESSLRRREMLTYIKSAVTRNASEKKINSLLDFVSQSTDMNLLQV